MPKERIRKAHAHVRIVEKCSEYACKENPIIEIQAWENQTYGPPILLCRKHFERKCEENPSFLPKAVIKAKRFIQDLRTYL